MLQEIIKKTKKEMEEGLKRLEDELKSVRTGRAQSSLVESIKVNYYGQDQPLRNLAQISVPESSLILIQPFDLNSLGDIRIALMQADYNPSDDGHTLRVVIAPMTEERRAEISKLVKNLGEEIKIFFRNHREQTLKEIKTLHKDKTIGDDDLTWSREKLDKIINEYNKQVDTKIIEKQSSLMKI